MRSCHNERGFMLLTIALVGIVFCGLLGLAIDLGQMYIAKTELQAFADSAVLAAAYELDGTSEGIVRARAVGQTGPGTTPNRWNFGTTVVDAERVQVLFSQNGTSGWDPSPGNPAGYRFAQVMASGPVNTTFLQVLRAGQVYSVPAVAFAGQLAQQNCGKGTGCDPFSPDAININDPDFGYSTFANGGKLYTLKWAPPGSSTTHRRSTARGTTHTNRKAVHIATASIPLDIARSPPMANQTAGTTAVISMSVRDPARRVCTTRS